ncbi:MAG: type I-U CRISPR-associated helicase/endonuclease Cas3 [Isosphaeraceae bacterium]
MNDIDFEDGFLALTGNEAFPWQRELYRRFANDAIPSSCNLPTGLGKTAVIPIWLIALANSKGRGNIPRRLVYVVNRRTVVDQATEEARRLRERLTADGRSPVLIQIAEALTALASLPTSGPLAISTLRGQFADNREWSADPARPAVIIGTVDMIGSRLLFSGYGIGFKSKPLHAGFLGQDVLLVHDEAHLEPAFQALIEAIREEQRRCREFQRFRVMALSATSRGAEEPFSLTDADLSDERVKKRIEARKAISLHPIEDEKKLADQVAQIARTHEESKRPILVFVRKVEDVEKVVKGLPKNRVQQLTGTLRGYERDKLAASDPIFRRFLPGAEPGHETVYLVCTSAGEVGVNITGDHLVCDLSTFESMAQRFGRVNRFGDWDDTRVDILHPEAFDDEDEYEIRRANTLGLLKQLNGEAGPAALNKLDPDRRRAAFSPTPSILPTSDILFDAWALTSVRDKLPGRPPVGPYLHGISAYEAPETRVAWRTEVEIIAGPLKDRYPPADLLAEYPIKPHELLRDRSDRVFKRLASLAVEHPERVVWLVDDFGTLEVLTLGEVGDKEQKDRIDNCTVLLPPSAGGLRGGLLTGDPQDAADDVADTWPVNEGEPERLPARARVWDRDGPEAMRLIRVIDTRPDADEGDADEGEPTPRRFWNWFVKPRSADDDESKTNGRAVLWDVHTQDVTSRATKIAERLELPQAQKRALIFAAACHDLGKRRTVWQRSIGNLRPTRWLAKSGRRMRPIDLTGYRHEFGSLLDAVEEPGFSDLRDDEKDIVLHLIAAHHGFGRPHFPPDLAFDLEPRGKNVASIAAEIPRRYARLQRRCGRWGLAYLESLLRAADYAASAEPSSCLADEEQRAT